MEGREVGTVTIRTVAIRVIDCGWASAIQLPTQTFRAADEELSVQVARSLALSQESE